MSDFQPRTPKYPPPNRGASTQNRQASRTPPPNQRAQAPNRQASRTVPNQRTQAQAPNRQASRTVPPNQRTQAQAPNRQASRTVPPNQRAQANTSNRQASQTPPPNQRTQANTSNRQASRTAPPNQNAQGHAQNRQASQTPPPNQRAQANTSNRHASRTAPPNQRAQAHAQSSQTSTGTSPPNRNTNASAQFDRSFLDHLFKNQAGSKAASKEKFEVHIPEEELAKEPSAPSKMERLMIFWAMIFCVFAGVSWLFSGQLKIICTLIGMPLNLFGLIFSIVVLRKVGGRDTKIEKRMAIISLLLSIVFLALGLLWFFFSFLVNY